MLQLTDNEHNVAQLFKKTTILPDEDVLPDCWKREHQSIHLLYWPCHTLAALCGNEQH